VLPGLLGLLFHRVNARLVLGGSIFTTSCENSPSQNDVTWCGFLTHINSQTRSQDSWVALQRERRTIAFLRATQIPHVGFVPLPGENGFRCECKCKQGEVMGTTKPFSGAQRGTCPDCACTVYHSRHEALCCEEQALCDSCRRKRNERATRNLKK